MSFPHPGIESSKYRPDIDGLRALAVLSVVVFHAFPKFLKGGFVGVDVFFVISGYLISSILFGEFEGGRFSFSAFYGRRIRRIFPSLILVMAVCFAYSFLVLMPVELAQLGKHMLFGAGFLSNIALLSESGYFDTAAAAAKPLLHLWSLGVEEQFYILWPATLWLIYRTRSNAALMLFGLFGLSFLVNILLAASNVSDDFYLPMSRVWELLTGAALAWAETHGHKPRLTPAQRNGLTTVGLASFLASAALYTNDLRFPGWYAVAPVFAAAAMILAGPTATVNRLVLANRGAVFIGLISYPIYIWHWPLISFAHILRLGHAPTLLMGCGLVAASILLAWLTYLLVERPLRFGMDRPGKTRLLAIAMTLLALVGAGTWAMGGFPGRYPALPNINIAKISTAVGEGIFKPTHDMQVTDLHKTLVTHLGDGERTVLLTGDSLLFQYGPRVQALHDQGRLTANVFFVTGASCPPVPGVNEQDNFAHCREMPGIVDEIIAKQAIRTVVIGASWGGYTGAAASVEREGTRLTLDAPQGQDAFYANLEDWVHRLRAEGRQVVLILPVPASGHFNPQKMIARSLTGLTIDTQVRDEVPVTTLRSATSDITARLTAIATRTGARTLDPLPDICGDGLGCSPFFDDGVPKYSDAMHLRPDFVAKNITFLDYLLTQ